jgi:catechol 2,3-dioxygenase-like lactoylglutathione lyase family enzyme
MTQIRGLAAVSRRPGELGVHSLNGFGIETPDLALADRFYRSFGLNIGERGDALDLYTEGYANPWVTLIGGKRRRLAHLSFGAFEEDLPAFKLRLERMGIALLDPPSGSASGGLWFRGHDGNLLEIRAAEKTSPNFKVQALFPATPGGAAAAPKRSQAAFVKPKRLAHILLFTSNVDKAVAFYSNVLGLRLSDRSGDEIAFMHGVHGSDHHLIAFVRSTGPGLHHMSWDVPAFNDVGLGAMQMADRGFSSGWGVGRHVLGSNYFHYVRDPWGSYAEYSCDIDYIPADVEWEAGDHDAEDAFYIWGPTPPPDFGVNHELAPP